MKGIPNYMNKTTAEALDKSIDKWWNILVAGGEDQGPRNCALCLKFDAPSCKGCPIAQKTGRKWCDESPYDVWSKHQDSEHSNTANKVHCSDCAELARNMHHFLVALKPKRHEVTYTLEEALRLGWRVSKTTWRHPLKTELRHTLSSENSGSGKALQFWDPREKYTNVFEPIKTKYWDTEDWVVHKDGFYAEPRGFSRKVYLDYRSDIGAAEMDQPKKSSKKAQVTLTIGDLFSSDSIDWDKIVRERIIPAINRTSSEYDIVFNISTPKKKKKKTGIERLVGKVVYRTGPNKKGDDSYTTTRIRITGVSNEYIFFDFYSGSVRDCKSSRDTWDDGRWVIDYDKCSYGIEDMVGKLAHRTKPAAKTGSRSFMDYPIKIVKVTSTHIFYSWVKKYSPCFNESDVDCLSRDDYDNNWKLWPKEY